MSSLALFAMIAVLSAPAEAVSDKPDSVAVVLYQDPETHDRFTNDQDDDGGDPGLAAVTETRKVTLPAGRTRIQFRGVADQIVPQTTTLQGLNGQLIERNYDFDLLTPGNLLDKAIGQRAHLVRTQPRTGKIEDIPVTVRSAPQGVILQRDDGSAEAMTCSGLPEKLVFERAPAGLNASPTLSVVVEAPKAGTYDLKLSYLATGLRWGADYVARINQDGRTLDLLGWLTLSNRSMTTFGHAPTQVVAGRLSRTTNDDTDEPDDQAPGAHVVERRNACWPIGLSFGAMASADVAPPPPMASPAVPAPPPSPRAALEEVVVTATRQLATVSNLGDYKLYTLPEPTTVAAKQTKQVAFLDQAKVPFDKVYEYRAAFDYQGAGTPVESTAIVLKMINRKVRKLGMPLPGGPVAMYAPGPYGQPFRIGEDKFKDTPVGLPLRLAEGQSPDVTVSPVQVAYESEFGARAKLRSQVKFTVTNASAVTAPVEIRLPRGAAKVIKESLRHTVDGADNVWTLRVPANGHAVLGYTLQGD